MANGDAVGNGLRRIARLWDRTFLEFGRVWTVPDAAGIDAWVEAGIGTIWWWNPSAWSNVSTTEAMFVSGIEG